MASSFSSFDTGRGWGRKGVYTQKKFQIRDGSSLKFLRPEECFDSRDQ